MGPDYFFKGVTFGYYARTGYFSSEAARCEAETASMRPYFWNNGKKYDGEEQANYLTAFFETFSGKPWWRGFCWWKWDENVDRPDMDSDPRGNKGFTLKGKPALELLREYTEMVRNSRLCGDGKLRFSIIDD